MSTPYSVYAAEVPVKVIVGNDSTETTFYLPPSLLKDNSRYFKSCLGGEFAESVDNTVSLRDGDPEIFSLFIDWMWKPELIQWGTDDIYVRLWIFADRVMCEALQNSCMNHLRAVTIGGLTGHSKCYLLKHICLHTSVDSQLYRYYVKQIAWDLRNDERRQKITSELEWKELSNETLRDLLIQAMFYKNTGRYKSENPAEMVGCLWHVHEDGSVGDCAAIIPED